MTTTTTEIRYTVHAQHLAAAGVDAEALAEFAATYRAALVEALTTAYPEAEIAIDIDTRTSGCVPGPRVTTDGTDMDTERETEIVAGIIDRTWERVCAQS